MRKPAEAILVSVIATAILASAPARAQAQAHGFFIEGGTGNSVLAGRVGYSGAIENNTLTGSRQGSLRDGMVGIAWNLRLAAGWGLAPHWTAGVAGEADYAPGFVAEPSVGRAITQSLLALSPELFARWDLEAGDRSGWWASIDAGAVNARFAGSMDSDLQRGDALDEMAFDTLWGPTGGLAAGYALRYGTHFEWGPRVGFRLCHASSRHGSLTYGALTLGLVLGRR